jgi:hypothetical protein
MAVIVAIIKKFGGRERSPSGVDFARSGREGLQGSEFKPHQLQLLTRYYIL